MSVKFIDQYEILGELGQGGMATVYRAQDPHSGLDVAIKVLRREYLTDLGFRARFQREAQMIAALQHPAVVPVLDFGQHQEQLYLVMPYMPGGSLEMRLLRGPLSPREAGDVLARIAAALDHAHLQGLVHRDLKPSNILFDAEGDASLADFGIAVQTVAGEGVAGVIDGTPAYMSPEQCRSEARVDGRSDVYSLGITLYEMLTGRVPFEGNTGLAILTQHLYRPAPSLRSANPSLPAALEPVLHMALAKEPAARYQRAGALSEVYEQKLAEVPEDGVAPAAGLADARADNRWLADEAGAQGALFVPPPIVVEESVPYPDSPPENGTDVALSQQLKVTLARLSERYGPWLTKHFYLALALVSVLGVASAAAAVSAIREPEPTPGSGIAAGKPTPDATAGTVVPDVAAGSPLGTPGVFLPLLESAALSEPPQPTATPAPAATPAANLLLLYSEESVTAINVSQAALSLAGVSFQRPASNSAGAAAFAADEWRGVVGNRVDALPPGDCLQLVRLRGGPAGAQKPEPCNKLQGWLGTSRIGRLFFVPQAGADTFEVYRGEALIGACALTEGQCRLWLPGS
jgi:serine/threonine-protein kinase